MVQIIVYSYFLPHPGHIQFPKIVIRPKISIETFSISEHVKWHIQHAVWIHSTDQPVEVFIIKIHDLLKRRTVHNYEPNL
jgi:hypothetical protein